MDISDPKMECPYNKSHVLLKSRMQTHLVKCKKACANSLVNSNIPPRTPCIFNANHHIDAHELDSHQRQCPDMHTLVRHTTNVGEGCLIPYKVITLPKSDENWDDSPHVDTYDPSVSAASKRVLRQKNGGSKSERKTFRFSERDRIGQFDDDEDGDAHDTPIEKKPIPMNCVERHAFTDEALRMPRGVSLAALNSQLGQGRGRVAVEAASSHASSAGSTRPIHSKKAKKRTNMRSSSASSSNEDQNMELEAPGEQSSSTSSIHEDTVVGAMDDLKMVNGNGPCNRTRVDFLGLPGVPGKGRGRIQKRK